jgi:MFS superfamily sulfate permease-like transporter
LRDLWAIGKGVMAGSINWAAFAIGGGALAIILLLKRHKRVPGILIAVIAATVIAGLLQLADRAGVSVLGPLPQGLPAFQIPCLPFGGGVHDSEFHPKFSFRRSFSEPRRRRTSKL